MSESVTMSPIELSWTAKNKKCRRARNGGPTAENPDSQSVLMTMIYKEVFFDIEALLCAILRNRPLSCCDIKNTKTNIEL